MYIDSDYSDADIAVVGMSCHFPDAKNYSEFWKNLVNEKESVSYFSDEELRKAGVNEEDLKKPDYVKAGIVLQDVEMFDASFFGLSPKEARHHLQANAIASLFAQKKLVSQEDVRIIVNGDEDRPILVKPGSSLLSTLSNGL